MPSRLPITKTPKCYVGGAFIRSESARTFPFRHDDFMVHIPLCSRKDLRNAVEAAAKAGPGWQKRSGYNRGQILYRLAEMLEARHDEMARALFAKSSAEASKEVSATVDRIVYYAGWADKYVQVLGSVNPVAAPYFNFTVSEPVGVCGVIAPDSAPLLGLITLVIPILVSGNTVLALASESSPYPAILLGEMLATSDLPAGVLNLLTGFRKEILPTMATHEHIRAVHAACDSEEQKALHLGAAESVKRVHCLSSKASTDWKDSSHQSLQMLANFVEYKTVWHPIGT